MADQPCRAIGIDLGTAYTRVAVCRSGGIEDVLDNGFASMPSCVAYTPTTILVGAAAKNQAYANPTNTVFEALRFIGRRFGDEEIKYRINAFPYKIVERHDRIHFRLTYKGSTIHVTPAEILALILARAKQNAEAYLGHSVDKAVITIPPMYRSRERRVIEDVARVAGLEVVSLISGATAAAVHYSLAQPYGSGEKCTLFFDLGAGRCNVTLADIEDDIIEIRAVAADDTLGGSLFDLRLFWHCARYLHASTGAEVLATTDAAVTNLPMTDPRRISRLLTACERAKRELSSQRSTLIEIESFYNGTDFRLNMDISQFEELSQDLARSVLEPVERILRDAKCEKRAVHEVVLLGGSSRIPSVQRVLSEYFEGTPISKAFMANESPACGAAAEAAIYSGQQHNMPRLNELLLLDIATVTLGIEYPAGMMQPIIKRNSTLPTKKSNVISAQDFSSRLVSIYEGECARVKDNKFLDAVELFTETANSSKSGDFELVFDVSMRGLLEVSVRSLSTNKRTEQDMSKIGTFRKREFERLQSSVRNLREDEVAETLRIKERDALETAIYNLETKMRDSTVGSAKGFAQLIESNIQWTDSNAWASADQYRTRLKELNSELVKLLATMQLWDHAESPRSYSTVYRELAPKQRFTRSVSPIRDSHEPPDLRKESRTTAPSTSSQYPTPPPPSVSRNSNDLLRGRMSSDAEPVLPQSGHSPRPGLERVSRVPLAEALPEKLRSSSNPQVEDLPLPQTRLGARQFRLLHRLDRRSMVFERRTHKVDYPPRFRALSYAWGSQAKDKTLLLYNQQRTALSEVKISETLQLALQELSTEDMPIWADAVCMNQEDPVEKSQQVGIMHQIYRRADTVAIWLGPHATDTAVALDVLRWVAAPPAFDADEKSLALFPALQTYLQESATELHIDQVRRLASTVVDGKQVPINKLDFHRRGLPRLEDPLWTALGLVLAPPWLTRLWTFQELLLGRKCIVAMGDTQLPWVTYLDVGMRFSRCNLLDHCVSRLPYSQEFAQRATTAFMRLVPFVDNNRKVVPFYRYLEEARSRDVTEAVDRIYAVLSLANDALRSKIPIEYSQTWKNQYWQLYVEAAKAIMSTSTLQAILGGANSEKKSSDLPSWCPDFSQPCETKPLDVNARAGLQYSKSFASHQDTRTISIGGAKLCSISYVDSSTWSWPTDSSTIYGPRGAAARNLQWLDSCWLTTQMTYHGDESRAQRAYVLTILGVTTPAKLSDTEALSWFNSQELALADLRSWLENLLLCAGPEDVEDSSERWHRFQDMARRLDDIWHNRRLCTTDSGRIGLCSRRAKPGDYVVLFFGEMLVYVVRARPAGLYEFVSEACVEGYMCGSVESDGVVENVVFQLR